MNSASISSTCKNLSNKDKWLVSVYAAVLFAVLASPFAFRLTDGLSKMVGIRLADAKGCPNMIGLALHSVVFVLCLRGLMLVNLPGLKAATVVPAKK